MMMMMHVSWISESRTREVFSDGTFVVVVVVVVVAVVVVAVEILTGMMEIVEVNRLCSRKRRTEMTCNAEVTVWNEDLSF
jgi:hypothetical protein